MLSEHKPSGGLAYRFIKRLFDIFVSVVLIIPIGIVICISGIIIKAEDGGSVFYTSDRTGRYGRIFKMYKLRSMKENSPDIRLADGSTYNGDDDPRVTKFGKLARRTSIDELPQIINVILGDMSFIGPRPDTPFGSAAYTEEEKIILTVRPGITGYNQAVNRNSVLTKDKLKNDIYYVQHLSLWFDFKIILMSVLTVLTHRNINRDGNSAENTFVFGDNESIVSVDLSKPRM